MQVPAEEAAEAAAGASQGSGTACCRTVGRACRQGMSLAGSPWGCMGSSAALGAAELGSSRSFRRSVGRAAEGGRRRWGSSPPASRSDCRGCPVALPGQRSRRAPGQAAAAPPGCWGVAAASASCAECEAAAGSREPTTRQLKPGGGSTGRDGFGRDTVPRVHVAATWSTVVLYICRTSDRSSARVAEFSIHTCISVLGV